MSGYRGRRYNVSRLKSEEDLLELGYSGDEISQMQNVVEAWKLMENTFDNFNGFVKGLWENYKENLNQQQKESVNEWEKRRSAAVEARDKYITSQVEIESQARLENLNLGFEKPKKKLPVALVREIAREIGDKNPFLFEEEKPEVKGVNFEERFEREKLGMDEIEKSLSKFAK